MFSISGQKPTGRGVADSRAARFFSVPNISYTEIIPKGYTLVKRDLISVWVQLAPHPQGAVQKDGQPLSRVSGGSVVYASP